MSLIRNFMSVGAATMASRVLGFARDTLIAANLGAGPLSDAFVVAFRLPNLFRRLFAEGAFNAAFVPLYAKHLEGEGEPGARAFAADVFAGLAFVLVVFSAIAMIGAPWLVTLLAPGYLENPEKFDLTVKLTVICFPYLACVSLGAMLAGILNSHRKFFLAAFAPVLLNVVTVIALLGVSFAGLAQTQRAAEILCWSIFLAGVLQVLWLMRGVWRAGAGFAFVRPRWTPQVKRLVQLGIPGALAGGITQINIVVGTMVASTQASANSFLYFADRIYQLPLGVVGVAIGVVLLPEIARQVRANRQDLVTHNQNRGLEFATVLTLPAAIALVVLAEPIIGVLYQRGAFTASDTIETALALAVFGAGLPAFVWIKVFSPGFFAREDTKTPMLFGLVSLIVNAGGSIAAYFLMPDRVHIGIALSTTVAGWVQAGLLYVTLQRRGYWDNDAVIQRRFPRIVIAALAMGAAVYGLNLLLTPWLDTSLSFAIKGTALIVLCGAGAAVFFGIAQVIGGIDLSQMKSQFRRKPRAPGEPAPPPTPVD